MTIDLLNAKKKYRRRNVVTFAFYLPRNKENPALGDILWSQKLIVINCITTLVSRKAGSKIIIALCWLTKLLHHDLLQLLLNLKHYKAKSSFRFQV